MVLTQLVRALTALVAPGAIVSGCVVKSGLIKRIKIVVQNVTAHPIDPHKSDCCYQYSTNYDQKNFHIANLSIAILNANPAKVGPVQSADSANYGRIKPGKSAHISFFENCDVMVASEKEDHPWLTIPNLRQAVAAALVLSLRPLLSCWYYFMRFLRAVLLRQQPIPQLLPQLNQPQRAQCPPHNNSDHSSTRNGERSNAVAFRLFSPHRPQNPQISPDIEVRPC